MERLGKYILSGDPIWLEIKQRASIENPWFIPEFIDKQIQGIAKNYLDRNALEEFVAMYQVPVDNPSRKSIGIIMAGNIPLVGFHDLL